MENYSVAFTGHRYEKLAKLGDIAFIERRCLEVLSDAIMREYERGARCFLSGMADGIDLWAAQSIITLRNRGLDITLTAVIPFERQVDALEPTQKMLYRSVLASADSVELLSPHYYHGVYHRRNDYLVDNALKVIAVCSTGRSANRIGGINSGTKYTLKRALAQGVEVENLFATLFGEELF